MSAVDILAAVPAKAHPIEEASPRIVEMMGYRLLMTSEHEDYVVSVMPLAGPETLTAPHTMAMLQLLPFVAQPKDIVLIGLGRGQQAKFIHKKMPDARLVAIEAKPEMVKIARAYFHLPGDDERLSVIVGESGAYMRANPNNCDVIFVDGYDHVSDIPDSPGTEEFYRACQRALRPGGVMAVNLRFAPGTPRHDKYMRMARSIFSADIQVEIWENQTVVFLFRDPPDISDSVLAKRAQELEKKLQLGLPDFVQQVANGYHQASYHERQSIVIKVPHFGQILLKN